MPKLQAPAGYTGNGSEMMLNPWMAITPIAGPAVEGLEGALGTKGLMGMGKSALQALKGAFGMAPEALPELPAAPLAEAPAALRQPKPGGVLYDVLERAGAKQGMGFGNTPGETRLLNKFNPIKGQ